jgi:hypothetical protein
MLFETNTSEHPSSVRNHLLRLIIISAGLFIIALAPGNSLFNDSHSICIHYRLLGFQCPLCGMTRAIHQLVHLQLDSAIQYNPVVAILPIYFGVDLVSYFNPAKRLILVRRTIFIVLLVALAVLYAVRISKGLS